MWQVGNIISGDYQILHVLGGPGKSGMGIVYVCYNQKSRFPVAVKTLQDKYLQDISAINRFKWEAEAWVRLGKHQNIVQAYFVEIIEDRPRTSLGGLKPREFVENTAEILTAIGL